MLKSAAPLTQPMTNAIKDAEKVGNGRLKVATGTRTGTTVALINRGLVEAGSVNYLTEAGVRLHENLALTAAQAVRDAELKAQRKLTAEEDAKLEAPMQAETHSVKANSEGYWTKGCGADILARDTQAVPAFPNDNRAPVAGEQVMTAPRDSAGGWKVTDAGRNPLTAGHPEDVVELDLPQRTPGLALTQELTGQQQPLVVAERPTRRLAVLLRDLGAEVLERATRETFVAVGAEWKHLEGTRVRIGCMGGDVFHQRNLHIMEAGSGQELDWKRAGDASVDTALTLHVGATVLVDGCRVYQVQASRAGDLPMLVPVK
jgi:hypothetical protein